MKKYGIASGVRGYEIIAKPQDLIGLMNMKMLDISKEERDLERCLNM